MTSALEIYEEGWPPGVRPPPRGVDLPYDDGEPMETPVHREQMNLLIHLFEQAIARDDVFVGGNMAFYYSALQAKKNDFKAPDVLVVLGARDNPGRLSWVVWEEDGLRPAIVVELLSSSTEANDRGPKKRIYEQLGVPEYYLYDPLDFRLEGWRIDGSRYAPIVPDADGRLACGQAGVTLGRWTGPHEKRTTTWLRLFDREGRLVPTRAEAETARAEAETARADVEAERARRAEARVAELLAELARRSADGAVAGPEHEARATSPSPSPSPSPSTSTSTSPSASPSTTPSPSTSTSTGHEHEPRAAGPSPSSDR